MPYQWKTLQSYLEKVQKQLVLRLELLYNAQVKKKLKLKKQGLHNMAQDDEILEEQVVETEGPIDEDA